jgi:hypothetical protein
MLSPSSEVQKVSTAQATERERVSPAALATHDSDGSRLDDEAHEERTTVGTTVEERETTHSAKRVSSPPLNKHLQRLRAVGRLLTGRGPHAAAEAARPSVQCLGNASMASRLRSHAIEL